MKELIEGLNLPKQILDKTEKFMSTLFGPSFKEVGELYADKIRYRRLKNQIDIFKKTISLLEENGLEAKELKLKTLVPLIEFSSLEDEPSLQDKWSRLIANICSSPENGLEPKLINTLSNLSSLEASIMDYIQEQFIKERKKQFEQNRFKNWKNVEDVPNDYVVLFFSDIKDQFKLTKEFTKIYIDNLESLGLVTFEEPQVEIENNTYDAEVIRDENNGGQKVDLDLDLLANYYKSDNIHITTYGNYFMKQCKTVN